MQVRLCVASLPGRCRASKSSRLLRDLGVVVMMMVMMVVVWVNDDDDLCLRCIRC